MVSTIPMPLNVDANTCDFCTVYPNGKMYNQSYFYFSIPYYNPKRKTPSISNAYVYSNSGNFVEITSSVAIQDTGNTGAMLKITFDSSYAGKLLRIILSDIN